MAIDKPRVAIVHDWLTNLGGAERVVLAMHQAFPEAPIFTSVYNQKSLPQFAKLDVQTSFLQHWPMATKRHQLYPTLRQLAFESFDWHGYDVVITSSTAEAKGIVTPTEVLHISYINTPTRYYWIDYEGYLAQPGYGLLNPVVRAVLPRWIGNLKRWDFAAAQRADLVISNSANVARRVKQYYQRDSRVLFPPVDVHRFDQAKATPGDYFLVVSRLIPYKKIDLVVEAFNQLGDRLVVVGAGSELARLQSMAQSNIEFVGPLPDDEVTKLYLGCRAFVFPTEEDFGITPLEAMACGKPAVAYGRGGAQETVVDGETGVHFDRQTIGSLTGAVRKVEQTPWDHQAIATHARGFSEENFIEQLHQIVSETWAKHQTSQSRRGSAAKAK